MSGGADATGARRPPEPGGAGAPEGESDPEGFRRRVRAWLEEHAPRCGWLPDSEAAEQRPTLEPTGQHSVERARECQRLLFEAGFAGITWPVEHGGRGLTVREQVVFDEEASRFDLPRGPFVIGLGMCGPTVLAVGTPEQKERYIRPLLSGREIWCQLFSEPGAGSDVAGLETRAERRGGEWVVSGQKVWTSGAHHSDFGLLLARTDPSAPKHRGLTMFVVDMRAPGVTVRPLRQMDGGAAFSEVFFDEVRVTEEQVLGGVGEGWRAAIATLMNERVSIGTGRSRAVQSVQSLIELARGSGASADPRVRDALAELYVLERIVSLIGVRVREAIKQGRQPGPEGSVAKLASTKVVRRSAELGVQLAGPGGAAWEAGEPAAGRWAASLLLAPAFTIAGGTDEVLRNIVGERVLGLPKEPQTDRDVPFEELARRAARR